MAVIVPDADAFFLGVVRKNERRGAKIFSRGDGHLRAKVGEDGRLDIVTLLEGGRTTPADHYSRTFLLTFCDIALNSFALGRGDERAQARCRIQGIAYL